MHHVTAPQPLCFNAVLVEDPCILAGAREAIPGAEREERKEFSLRASGGNQPC